MTDYTQRLRQFGQLLPDLEFPPVDNPVTVRNRARAVQQEHDRQEAFARLNPDFGVLPDDRDPQQHRFAQQRERALALGERVAAAELSGQQRGGPSDLFSVPPVHPPTRPERAASLREHTHQPTTDRAGDQPTRYQATRQGAER